MVQDMMETEYFSTASKGEASEFASHLAERAVVFLTPLAIDAETDHRDKRPKWEEGPWCSDGVVAKLYYEQYPDSSLHLLLNDIVSVTGVLEEVDDSPMEMVDGPMIAPPHIWRLHVTHFRKLTLETLPVSFTPQSYETVPLQLSQALGVPLTVAWPIALTLLSKAERDSTTHAPIAKPDGSTLGCSSLQLVCPDVAACEALFASLTRVLSTLVPVLVSWDLTRDLLDELPVPSREEGRLLPTPLQLPRGATVLLNTCHLSNGPLSEPHVQTLQALQELVQNHRVPYQFEGGTRLPFEADVSVIVVGTLSTRSLLQATWNVEATPSATTTPSTLTRDSWYTARRGVDNIRLAPAILQCAEQHFVQERARDPQTSEADIHRWLTVTRLVARSRASTHAEVSDWERALKILAGQPVE